MSLLAERAIMGGANGGWQFVKSYTVPESWENDSLGMGVIIFNTVMEGEQLNLTDIVLMMVRNNTAPENYNLKLLLMSTNGLPAIALSNSGGYIIRGNNSVRPCDTTYSAWISKGAIIDVYRMKVVE